MLAESRLSVIGANEDVLGAARSDREGKTSGEMLKAAHTASAKIWTVENGTLVEHIRFPLLEPFPIVEQFPDGRWLVTQARASGKWNARIFDMQGTEQDHFFLGDGIEHIKIDSRSRIWVGWFDEGIGGNRDWRVPGQQFPPSTYGLASFDEMGMLISCAPPVTIDDCYALNVAADVVWGCTYTDFPIWRLGDDFEDIWQTKLIGTSALAVKWPHVLAAGGYGDNAGSTTLFKLDETTATTLGEWNLPLGDHFHMMDGRDDELHVVQNGQWQRWKVDDFIELCD